MLAVAQCLARTSSDAGWSASTTSGCNFPAYFNGTRTDELFVARS